MADEYKVHIRTTADPSGAEITQDALEQTAQAGEKIVDAVTKGDRATANFVAKLKQLSPEQIDRVEKEMLALAAAEEAAGRDAAALRAQLQQIANVNVDKQSKAIAGIFGGVTAGTLAAQAITQVTQAVGEHARASVDLADKLNDLSSRSGVSAEALQTIGNAASQNGGSLDAVAASLSKLTVNAQSAAAGSKPLEESFRNLGITSDDLKNLSPDELFYKISEAVATSSDRGRTYADVVKVMGKASIDLFATLETGPESIRKVGTEMGVFSDQTVKDLANAKDALGKFQNQLTIFAGESITALVKLREGLITGYAEAFQGLTDWLNDTKSNLGEFSKAEERRAQATENATKKTKVDTETLGDLGDAAGAAADEVEKLTRQFAERVRAKLPIGEQVEALRKEIERVRAESEKALPGLKFADANALFELSKMSGLSKDTRTLVRGLALEYAGLEDKLKQTSDADQKAQPDRLKRIEEIHIELKKPNVSIAERNKLYEEELRLLGEIKTAAEARAKADAAAKAPPKPLSDPAALARSDAALEVRSRGGAGNDLNELQRKLDERARAAQAELATAIDQIPHAIGDIQTVAAKGFDDIHVELQKVAPAFTEAAAPVAEATKNLAEPIQKGFGDIHTSISALGSTMQTGLATTDSNLKVVTEYLIRQITGLKLDIGALQRR